MIDLTQDQRTLLCLSLEELLLERFEGEKLDSITALTLGNTAKNIAAAWLMANGFDKYDSLEWAKNINVQYGELGEVNIVFYQSQDYPSSLVDA